MKALSTVHSSLSTKSLSSRTVLLLTVVGAAILLFPTIFWPFDYDQGTFAYGGSAILHGAKPYIDFWDIKPPNIFYTYATAFAIFGNSVQAIRIFDYLNALLTVALIVALAFRLWKNTPWRLFSAVFASLIYVIQYYIFGHWDTAQAETYCVPLVLAALLLVVPRRAKFESERLLTRALFAGVLVGATFYFKYPNALFLMPIAAALWQHSGHDRYAVVKALSMMVVGFLAVIGVQSLYLYLNGELGPLYQLTMSSTASYVSTNYSGKFTLFQNLRTASQVVDLVWIAAAAFGWSIWITDRKQSAKHNFNVFRSLILLLLGATVALLVVQLQNKGYKYHYAVLLPWVDLLIGAGVGHIVKAMSSLDWLPKAVNAVLVAVGLVVLCYIWTSFHPLHERVEELVKISEGKQPANGYIAGDSIANYVSSHTRPSDRIFIFGFQPYVYWKTGRVPATKFLNTIHFKPIAPPHEERDELVHSLLGNPPTLFLVETDDRYTSQGNTNDDSRTTIRLRFPELEQLLDYQYWPEDTIQHTIIYRLRP